MNEQQLQRAIEQHAEVSMGKVVFLPISVGVGLLAGLIGKKIFG